MTLQIDGDTTSECAMVDFRCATFTAPWMLEYMERTSGMYSHA